MGLVNVLCVLASVIAVVGFTGCSSSNDVSCSYKFNGEYAPPSDTQESCTAWGEKYGCSSAELMTGSACSQNDQCCNATGCTTTPTCP